MNVLTAVIPSSLSAVSTISKWSMTALNALPLRIEDGLPLQSISEVVGFTPPINRKTPVGSLAPGSFYAGRKGKKLPANLLTYYTIYQPFYNRDSYCIAQLFVSVGIGLSFCPVIRESL